MGAMQRPEQQVWQALRDATSANEWGALINDIQFTWEDQAHDADPGVVYRMLRMLEHIRCRGYLWFLAATFDATEHTLNLTAPRRSSRSPLGRVNCI